MTLPPASRLGPTRLSRLGAGGMERCTARTTPCLGREVAIKVLPERVAADPDGPSRGSSASEAIAALSAPKHLAIFDFGSDNWSPTRHRAARGGTLAERPARWPMATEALARSEPRSAPRWPRPTGKASFTGT